MEYVLLVLTIFGGGIRSVVTKIVNKGANSHQATKTNAWMFLVAFITVLLMGITSISTIFEVPWCLTIVYAVSMVMAQFCLMKAVELGSVSVSSLIYYCGLIIALLFGCLYYRETVNALHIIGVLFILGSFFLSIKKEKQKVSLAWAIAAFGGCLFGGLMGVWQKIFRYEYPQYSSDNFMQASFLLMIIFSFLIVAISRVKQACETKKGSLQKEEKKETDNKWKKIGLIVALGVTMAMINKINIFLSGELPTIVVFPCIYGGGIIASSLLSAWICKEKSSRLQKLSVLVGIVGIIFIGFGSMLL